MIINTWTKFCKQRSRLLIVRTYLLLCFVPDIMLVVKGSAAAEQAECCLRHNCCVHPRAQDN